VWIDSLCIIQDDSQDWLEKGGKMDQVYKNAHVTIVATSATCSTDGFLHNKSAESRIIVPVINGGLDSSTTDIILQPLSYGPMAHYHREVEQSVWNSRAWTTQERYLSQRTLHFAATQVYWECCSETKAESGQKKPGLIMPNINAVLREKFDAEVAEHQETALYEDTYDYEEEEEAGASSSGELGLFPTPDFDDLEALREVYSFWTCIVNDYSPCKLTYATDKLPALAGLAAETARAIATFSSPRHARYLAGIWVGNLAQGLMWKYVYPEQHVSCIPKKQPGNRRAPTWSWMSCDGQVYFKGEESSEADEAVEVIEFIEFHHKGIHSSGSTSHSSTGSNPFIGYDGGILEIAAKRVRVSLSGHTGRSIFNGHVDEPRFDMFLHSPDRSNELQPETGKIGIVALDHAVHEAELDRESLYALQVLRQPPGAAISCSVDHWWGLLIQEVVDRDGRLIFERVGTYRLEERGNGIFEGVDMEKCLLV
jgi:hypothetical protein